MVVDRIEGFEGASPTTQRERDWLLSHVPRNGTMLEIGTLHGVMVGWLASQRPDINILSVDPFIDDAGMKSCWRMNHQSNQHLYVGTTKDPILERHYLRHFDLVFIDGDHSLEWCTQDIYAGERLATVDGYLVCHDCYHAGGRFSGVLKAVEAWCDLTSFEIHHTIDSMVVLKRGKP